MSTEEREQEGRQERPDRREEAQGPISGLAEKGSTEGSELQQALESCQRELEAAHQEVRSRKDDLLRARAELDNAVKRGEREVEKARKFALAQFLPELLPVKDSLESGLAAAGRAAAAPEALREGMRLTLEKLTELMKRFGIEEIAPREEPFDPERHEAIAVQEAADIPPNTVTKVHQKGYLLNGRLLRPARVTVSRFP